MYNVRQNVLRAANVPVAFVGAIAWRSPAAPAGSDRPVHLPVSSARSGSSLAYTRRPRVRRSLQAERAISEYIPIIGQVRRIIITAVCADFWQERRSDLPIMLLMLRTCSLQDVTSSSSCVHTKSARSCGSSIPAINQLHLIYIYGLRGL